MVELLVSITVFSTVLLLCSMAIVHVGKMYYKGMITNRTQDAARQVMESVTAAVQFGDRGAVPELVGDYILSGVTHRTVCIGKTRFTYAPAAALGTGTGKSRHILWRDRVVNECYTSDTSLPDHINLTLANPGGSGGQELLGSNMRTPELSVTSVDGITWDIVVRVAYGDEASLFENPTPEFPVFSVCKGSNAGGQFCATSQLTTSVIKRL